MSENQKDTNIVSADDLSFLKNIGMGVPTPTSNETTEVVIEETITEVEEPNIVEAPPVTTTNNNLKDSINLLISSDTWEDTPLKYEDNEYENISDLISKVEVNDTLFESLTQLQKELKENQIKTDYLSLKDKDETKVKLAKAILEGIDYKDLLEHQENFIDPISNLDLSDESVLEEFVIQGLGFYDGIPQKYINAEINELKNNYKLVEKAEEYKKLIKKNYEDEIQTRTEDVINERARLETERKENIKTLRKDLKDNNFSQTFIDKATQLRYDINDNGEEHYISLIKNKIKEDKDFQQNLMHMLLDEKDFVSKIKAPIKQETTKKVLELINVVPKNNGKSPNNTSSNPLNLSEADANFLDIINNSKK